MFVAIVMRVLEVEKIEIAILSFTSIKLCVSRMPRLRLGGLANAAILGLVLLP